MGGKASPPSGQLALAGWFLAVVLVIQANLLSFPSLRHMPCAVVLMCSPCEARWGTRRQQPLVIALPLTLKTAVHCVWGDFGHEARITHEPLDK